MSTITFRAQHACTYLGDNQYDLHPERAERYEFVTPKFATREEAEAFVALFPKSAKFRVFVSTAMNGEFTYAAATSGVLRPTAATGPANETAIKRYRAIIKAAARQGIEVVTEPLYINGYADRAAFEAAL